MATYINLERASLENATDGKLLYIAINCNNDFILHPSASVWAMEVLDALGWLVMLTIPQVSDINTLYNIQTYSDSCEAIFSSFTIASLPTAVHDA